MCATNPNLLNHILGSVVRSIGNCDQQFDWEVNNLPQEPEHQKSLLKTIDAQVRQSRSKETLCLHI